MSSKLIVTKHRFSVKTKYFTNILQFATIFIDKRKNICYYSTKNERGKRVCRILDMPEEARQELAAEAASRAGCGYTVLVSEKAVTDAAVSYSRTEARAMLSFFTVKKRTEDDPSSVRFAFFSSFLTAFFCKILRKADKNLHNFRSPILRRQRLAVCRFVSVFPQMQAAFSKYIAWERSAFSP